MFRKIILFCLFALIVVSGYLFFKSRIYKVSIIEISITINVPIYTVYPYLADPDMWHHWRSSLVKVEKVSNNWTTKGALIKETIEREGREFVLRRMLLERKSSESLEMEVIAPNGFISTNSYALKGVDGGTKIHFNDNTTYYHFLARAMSEVITVHREEIFKGELDKLKNYLENRF